MFEKNLEFIDEALRIGFFTHCYLEAGYLSEPNPTLRMTRAKDESRSVYDLASLTKAIVTTPLAIELLSEFENPNTAVLGDWLKDQRLPQHFLDIKIEDLLSHRSGLPAWTNFWIERLQPAINYRDLQTTAHGHIAKVLSRRDYVLTPGQDTYSDIGFILLGMALEQHYQLDLAQIFNNYLQSSQYQIQLGDNFGFPTNENWSRQKYITTAYCPIREKWLRGEVHDENAASLGGIAGHAGFFASGKKLGNFLRQHFQSDNGHQFWLEQERRRVIGLPILGLRPGSEGSVITFANGESLGHWGFTGTGFWVHVPSTRYAIVLTNRVISGRLSVRTKEFRQRVLAHLNHVLLTS